MGRLTPPLRLRTGLTTTFGYDKRRGRIAVTNARGYTWTAQFDVLGREYADVDPLGRRTTLAFDARSLVSQKTDGKGQVETRLYDALGRQTGSQYADGTIVTLTFDALGRKLTEANQNGIWTRTYDAVGQGLTELGPGYPRGLPLASVYDAIGNRTQLQSWRGSQSWGLDGLNRLRSLTDVEGGTYTWSYDLHQRLSELDYPNGVIFTATYDTTGWPSQGSCASAGTPIELRKDDSGPLTAHALTAPTPSPSGSGASVNLAPSPGAPTAIRAWANWCYHPCDPCLELVS